MSRILYSGEEQITNSYRARIHEAVDVVKKWYQADTVIAHAKGTVVMVQTGRKTSLGSTGNASYGNFVKILHPNGYYTLYAHLNAVYVKKGQTVQKGTKLGYMGKTDNAYGVHLHFEVRNPYNTCIDSTNYLNSDLPSSNRGTILYQAYDNVKRYWLPNVSIKSSDYAGNFGKTITIRILPVY